MKLKYITFTLENCDQVTIDGKYIGDFYVSDIKQEIRRIACNSMMKIDTAREFAIEIHKNANKEHLELGCESFKTTVFEALTRCDDITSIEFELEEQYVEDEKIPAKEHYDYFVDWCGESDCVNEAQKSYVSKPGHLYLVIDKNSKIEDYFNKKEIDDEETMDFQFEMYDVGNEENDNYDEMISKIGEIPEEYYERRKNIISEDTFEIINKFNECTPGYILKLDEIKALLVKSE